MAQPDESPCALEQNKQSSNVASKPDTIASSPLASRKPRATQRPFYETPDDKPTPVQIVNESRNWLRTVPTKRPFTPREDQRTLFGQRPAESRPPSAFSLGSRHFDLSSDGSNSGSRPPSGSVRLIPLDHQRAGKSIEEISSRAPKPPSGERSNSGNSRRKNSANRSPESSACVRQSSQNLSDAGSQPTTPTHQSVTSLLTLNSAGGAESPPRRISPKKRSPPRGNSAGMKPDSGYGSESRGNSAGSGSRASSAGAHGPDTEASGDQTQDAAFFTRHITPLLERLMSGSNVTSDDAEELIDAAEELYSMLEKGGMLGRRCRRRVDILTTVCQLLDRSQPRLQLALGRIIFALKVSGNNLLNVCKLVFKVSKEKSNDTLFSIYAIPPYLLRCLDASASGFDSAVVYETLVYCAGAVKFLTDNPNLVDVFVAQDAVNVLTKLASRLVGSNEASGRTNERLAHVLIQVVGALRHCAEVSGSRERFLEAETLTTTPRVMEQYPSDSELLLACSKLLSKLSTHPSCCQVLSTQPTFCQRCLHLLNRHHTKEDLVLRLSYVLGNMMARFEDARSTLFPDKTALDQALAVLKFYMERDKSVDSRAEKTEDIIVKMVRFIANAAISDCVGPIIAQSNTTLKILLKIIKYKDPGKHEELVMNAVYAVNNLTFYMDVERSSDVVDKQMAIAESLLSIVYLDNLDLLRECVRVFGNLSRSGTVRDFLIAHQVDRVLVTLLDSRHQETVYATLGVLLNLMADPDKRSRLRQDSGLQKLFDILKEIGWIDWQVAGLVCKTLWNFTDQMTSSESELGAGLAAAFVDLLIGYVDRDYVHDLYRSPDTAMLLEEDEEVTNLRMELWESEFLPVGRDLLERLERHQSPLEPL